MSDKILSVPFMVQNDNDLWSGVHGSVQCCPTANAMLAATLDKDMIPLAKKNGFREPESYYKSKFQPLGYSAADRGNHDAHTRVLESAFGIKSQWRTDITSKDIVRSLDADIPIVVGFEYKYSGHICIITGYYSSEGGGLYVHDPYGLRAGSDNYYHYINPGYGDQSGKHDRYSWGLLNHVLFERGTPNRGGWGRWVTSVAGKPTGL
jgi:hypothetical protein